MGDDEKGYLEHAWRLNINLDRKHAPVANEAAGAFFWPDFVHDPMKLDGPLYLLCECFFSSFIGRLLRFTHFVTFFTKKACSLPNGCAKRNF